MRLNEFVKRLSATHCRVLLDELVVIDVRIAIRRY